MTHSSRRSAPSVVVFALFALIAGLVPGGRVAASEPESVSVIVRAESGGMDLVRLAVARVGGSVTIDLPVIDGFAASIPRDATQFLSAAPGVASLTEDFRVTLNGRRQAGDEAGPSISTLTTTVLDLDRLWRRGITGDGVGVALIDSGVAPVGGLDAPEKVVNGPDLSFDSQFDNLRYLDAYGHGTHLAGIIAGVDPSLGSRPTERDVRTNFAGVAPGARIVSVKVADGLGTADVSQVIAGIQWVIDHKDDPEASIRVLNLAFGTDGVQDYRIDPLAYAVEQAWHAGLVVIVASGNDGTDEPLRNPATDPFVISVGASDPNGTRGTNDDVILDFSNCGVDDRTVDLIAPGRSISSLRVAGSYVDSAFPEAADGERFFRGTGTSQAAAVTSGVVALMLDARPDLTPDQVKVLLTTTADPIRSAGGTCEGVGMVDAHQAVMQRHVPKGAVQTWDESDGTGSLEAARGSYHVYRDGVALVGEIDILGNSWSGGTWSVSDWD